MKDLKVGQTVYLKPVGNQARRSSEIREAVISRVGRKYFYLEGYHREKFGINEMCDMSEYSTNWMVYISKQEIEDKSEANRLYSEIQGEFNRYRNPFPLEVLRRIAAILGI